MYILSTACSYINFFSIIDGVDKPSFAIYYCMQMMVVLAVEFTRKNLMFMLWSLLLIISKVQFFLKKIFVWLLLFIF